MIIELLTLSTQQTDSYVAVLNDGQFCVFWETLLSKNCCLAFNQTMHLDSSVEKECSFQAERTREVFWILLSKREIGKYQQLPY